MAWTMDIQGPNGGANLATGVPFKAARITWTADGPGAADIDLRADQVSTFWGPVPRRVVIKLDGAPRFAGYLANGSRSGAPNDESYTVSALGLAWILDLRLVHAGGYVVTDTTANMVEVLLDDAQTQPNGDMGFHMGTVTGTTPTRTRSFCRGVIIGEAIRELASIRRGFDWEVDANGALNIFAPRRGVATGRTLEPSSTIDWQSEWDTTEMVTTVMALGETAEPFGPRFNIVRNNLADTYGRREIPIDVATTDRDELKDAAAAELTAKAGAHIRTTATWIEGRGPWSFGDVWIQDRVTVANEAFFGGSHSMRCTDITVTLDPNPPEVWFVEQSFETYIEDLTVTDESEGG